MGRFLDRCVEHFRRVDGASLTAFPEAACRAIDGLPDALEKKGAGRATIRFKELDGRCAIDRQ